MTALVERVRARDWREVPKGYYAIPVSHYEAWTEDCPDDWKAPIIGYRLFERKVARHYKTGRSVGRERFVTGSVVIAPGADPDEMAEQLWTQVQGDRAAAVDVYGPGGDLKEVVDMIVSDVEDQDTYRATFGRLTGKCGHCGKALTDPTSKMIGIGPDCRGYR